MQCMCSNFTLVVLVMVRFPKSTSKLRMALIFAILAFATSISALEQQLEHFQGAVNDDQFSSLLLDVVW